MEYRDFFLAILNFATIFLVKNEQNKSLTKNPFEKFHKKKHHVCCDHHPGGGPKVSAQMRLQNF